MCEADALRWVTIGQLISPRKRQLFAHLISGDQQRGNLEQKKGVQDHSSEALKTDMYIYYLSGKEDSHIINIIIKIRKEYKIFIIVISNPL